MPPTASTVTVDLATPRGPARAHIDEPSAQPSVLLVLGHGAGGGVTAPDLLAVRAAALAAGAVVARVEQPYRVAGRRSPAPAAHLDEAWTAVVAALRECYPGLPLVTGGRSSGARVACRTAAATGAAAVIALAFPLRPPAHPERSRAAELLMAGVPVLVVNGDRDPFGVPEETEAVTVRVITGADHSLRRAVPQLGAVVANLLGRIVTEGKQSTTRGVGMVSHACSEDS
ncbi:MAG: alpha/beta hydrolase [Actinomycetota bacterium]|nr:alpha/beta hydrolase [Actinomycetota bacterium]